MKFPRIGCKIIQRKITKGLDKTNEETIIDKKYKPLLDVSYNFDGNEYHKFFVLFAPEKRKNICIIDIHGGAYLFGHRIQNYEFGKVFLDKGFDYIGIDYIPNINKRSTYDMLNDCAECLDYIAEHLKELGLENDKLVLMGDSAGGHMALVLAEMICDKNFARGFYGKSINLDIKCLLVNCPAYDFVNLGTKTMTKAAQKYMFGPKWYDLEIRKPICPKYNIAKLNIPVFLSTASKDFLRNESLMLKEDLERLGIEHEFVDVHSDSKPFMHVHNIVYLDLPESQEVNKNMMDFAIKHCS